MKTYIPYLLITLLMLATVLAFAWLGDHRKSKTRQIAKETAALFMLGLLWALSLPAAIKRLAFGQKTVLMANSYAVGEHENGDVPSFATSAITQRHLLFTRAATGVLTLAGAKSQPDGVVADEVSATDIALFTSVPVNLRALGKGSTKRMIASSANCTVGAVVYPAANGKVRAAADIPGSDGTNFAVGKVVSTNGVAPADGDEIEVNDFVDAVGKAF